ncbi:MAG: Uma2 family endonuclease [Microcystis aeruginosa G11-04]|uniref:Uma2 family endonuclease n=1 Tax=Microcystis aeruginosa G11-04 TaxID=2685956 RepID=A0A966FWL5_MICAE|nr:Uma2 family endonuclease [Microcystis aeruginosa G11-04]
MLTQSPPKTLSLEEYRNLETIAEVKHEYHDGEIIEMTGGSINHNSILINLIVLLKLALRGTNYRLQSSDLRLWIPQYNRGLYQLNQYLLVSQGEILIESYSKTSENHWLLQEYIPARGIISLDSLGISLNLADIYEGIDFN